GLALIAALALGATLAITYLANAPTKATQAEADAAASLGSTAQLTLVVSALALAAASLLAMLAARSES
ncbi:MAG: hypothetical protein ACYDCK_07035, partial [Thermoplasmatota archaeon]